MRAESAPKEPGESLTPQCPRCATKNVMVRLVHHLRSFPTEKALADHLLAQYGQKYMADGRLRRRLDLVRETWRIYTEPSAQDKQSDLAEAYAKAMDNLRSRSL